MKRLKAFTLMEMILAMVLTGLVLGVAGMSYLIIVRQMGSFRQHADSTYALQKAFVSLHLDFQKPGMIYRVYDGVQISAADGKEIHYHMEPTQIIRTQGEMQEKWEVNSSAIEEGFQNEPSAGPDGVIDELSFTLVSDKLEFPVKLHRTYSAAELMSIEEP